MALGDKYSTALPRSVEPEARWFKIAGVSGEPNHLCLFFEWQSVAKAKEFLGSAELVREMERAGVTEKPEIDIAEELASGKL
jgi:hypothetical protein